MIRKAILLIVSCAWLLYVIIGMGTMIYSTEKLTYGVPAYAIQERKSDGGDFLYSEVEVYSFTIVGGMIISFFMGFIVSKYWRRS